jgi:hypothetical protein
MIIILLLNFTGFPVGIPAIPIIKNINVVTIIQWVFDIAQWLIGIAIYTVPNMVVINMILWSFRVIVFIELAIYLKELINPLS